MAQPSNLFDSYDAKGIRESLSDVISRISPEETPFISNVGKSNVKNTYFEWQTDALDSVDTANKHIEGDDADAVAQTPTKRLANYAQISRKVVATSGTVEATDRAGRKGELAYLMAKASASLKRDMEAIATQNQAAAAGSNAAARATAGVESFLRTNVSRGATGANPTLSGTSEGFPNAAPTDGTQRAFTETLLKGVIQSLWAAGGTPKMLMLGPKNTQAFSAFAGIASTRFNVQGAKKAAIIGSASIYVSDFGNLEVVSNRFSRDRSALLLDPEYAELAYLRPFQTVELAKTGDSDKKMIVVEWGVKVVNEAAHGVVADLTTP
jgi:hypothetical protein